MTPTHETLSCEPLVDESIMIQTEGFEALVDAYVYDMVSQRPLLRLVSLVARPSVLKSIMANVSLSNKLRITHAPEMTLPRSTEEPIRIYQRRLPSGLVSLLLLPKAATTYGVAPGKAAYLVTQDPPSDKPPPGFLPILDRLVPYPLLQLWTQQLWQWGFDDEWIQVLPSYNVTCYRLDPVPTKLREQISAAIRNKRLPITAKPERANR